MSCKPRSWAGCLTDRRSGSVCLDVINQTWSPMFGASCSLQRADVSAELINIFEIFLPQLLRYPNPADPLNGEAAALLMRDPKAYAKKVESYVDKYASNEDADRAGENGEDDEPMSRSSRANGNGRSAGKDAAKSDEEDEEDDDPMSDMGELSDGDEFMGEMDD